MAAVSGLVTLRFDELVELARYGVLAEQLSVAAGSPAVVVCGNPTQAEGLVEDLRTLPCVLVAEPGASRALETFVDVCPPSRVFDGVLETVTRFPLASTSLALLLRGGDRGIQNGLVAESTTYSMLQSGPEFRAWRDGRPARAAREDATPVLIDRQGDTLVLTLNRPEKHNAYNAAVRDALAEALQLALIDDALHVMLQGNGASFCSGGDLDEFDSFDDPVSAHAIRLARSVALLMARLTNRLSVRVHGSCLGSGIELAAFAHHIVAAPDTRFGLPEISLGLIPGAGGTVSMPRRIGRHRTALLAFQNTTINAITAKEWGLVDAISST